MSLSMSEALADLYGRHFGSAPTQIDPLPLSGSDRRYYRLHNPKGGAVIGTYNPIVAENNTYFYFTELLRKHSIAVPEVYAVAKDRRYYLQQDLGTTSLFDRLLEDGFTDGVRAEYSRSIAQLARMQWMAGRTTDFNQCCGAKTFDQRAIMADLQYFKYYFADIQKLPYNRHLLQDEMESMAKEIGRLQPQTLMYRDFQSRNIMLHEGKVWFIDFQGAMQGPPQYDIASLLWQARASLPAHWREDLLNTYVTFLSEVSFTRVDEIYFRRGYAQTVLLRLLQVLGAYGFRGLMEGKPHFRQSIAPALKNLEIFLSDHPQLPAYPEMRGLLERLVTAEIQEKYAVKTLPRERPLIVHVASFSYKKGIPQDVDSGHGGGYVFDCRGLLNPGRYETYQMLTGRDNAVKDFLETKTAMPSFLESAQKLVSLNVEDYLSRGFEHLSVAFGCTGGQHRSVYAAEAMAGFLRQQYGVNVEVKHLNAEAWKVG